MICGALAPDAACAVITLDTTPPVLFLSGPDRLEPPDSGLYTVRSSEPMGRVGIVLYDATDHAHVLGATRVDPHTLTFTLPASGLPRGSSRLLVAITDLACNQALVEATVFIARPRLIDILTSVGPALRLGLSERPAMDLQTEIAHPSDLTLRQNRTQEVITTTTAPFTMETRVDGDQ